MEITHDALMFGVHTSDILLLKVVREFKVFRSHRASNWGGPRSYKVLPLSYRYWSKYFSMEPT